MTKKVLTLLFLCCVAMTAFPQSPKTQWVDSVFNQLSAAEKIGQLFMIPVDQNVSSQSINEIENLIKSHHVGGLIFKNVGPVLQARLINHFQRVSKVPLLVARESDLRPGQDSTIVFPPSLILGATTNDTLLYQVGRAMAGQLKTTGVNVMFTPLFQVTEPVSRVPADPLFEKDNNYRLVRKSIAIMRGLQDHGVLASAGYLPMRKLTVLPGGGEVPSVEAEPDSAQRFAYSSLIANGLRGIVPDSSNVTVTYADSTASPVGTLAPTLASLSAATWLKRNTGFHGLSFVDLSRMKKPAEFKDGDIELLAFEYGNDILLYPGELGAAIRKVRRVTKKDGRYEEQLDQSVRNILEAKFDAGLWHRQDLVTDNIQRKLNSPEVRLLNQKLFESAVTVVRNERNVLPVRVLENRSFAYIAGSTGGKTFSFFEFLNKYVHTDFFTIEDRTDQKELLRALSRYDVVFVGVFPDTDAPTLARIRRTIGSLRTKPEIVFCDFGNPAILEAAHEFHTLVTAYVAEPQTFQAVPQVMFGALPALGILPYSPSVKTMAGTGIQTESLRRLAYSTPEDAAMDGRLLAQIDSIALEAIAIGATPGCQVFVARKGKVIYEKSFGHLTYEKNEPVTDQTIYDLASVTKVSATLQTAMFMHERGLIDLNRKVSHYLPELKKSNKKDITFIDMLTHQSGLVPFLLMYPNTMKDTTYLPVYYSRTRSDKYPLQVSPNLYASTGLRDSVWSWVLKSKMSDKPPRTPYSYKYSDLGFLILQRAAETLLNQPLDEFLHQNLYEPLGSHTTGFNPLTRFSRQAIAPTEDDKIYRRTSVAGTVHDERAAMMGGVAGHAGLFSSAGDLGKFGQMLLQEGYYGGTRYYKPETVRLFVAKKYRNSRRGIGWDKPVQSSASSPTSLYASPSTYGHTGFTGTCIWVDPEFDLVYIFLSNRVYPDRNNKLSNANIRSRIQDVVYKSIFSFVGQEKPAFNLNDYAINAGSPRPLE